VKIGRLSSLSGYVRFCSEFGEIRELCFLLIEAAISIHLIQFWSILMPATGELSLKGNSMGRINVLSIDGGGIRGIIPASILATIHAGVGQPLHKVFDLISGTSTGGIIALGIGTTAKGNQPYAPAELVKLYVDNGPAIFQKNFLTPAKSLFGPKYSPYALEQTLENFFGDTRFSTALTPLLISSYDLATQLPYFFKSHRIGQNPAYDWEAKKIARATSAAPTYFPPFRATRDDKERALADGGIFVNNPAMAAYAEARKLYAEATDFFVVSVGTGDRSDRITYQQAKRWGLLGWARQIIPVMMDSVSEAVDYELNAIFGSAAKHVHFRLQPELTIASNDMDDASSENLGNLNQQAAEFLRTYAKTIQKICGELGHGRGSNLPGTGWPANGRSIGQSG
jgi:uncharacterized protein